MSRSDLKEFYKWINRIDNHLLFNFLELYNDFKAKHLSYEAVIEQIRILKKEVRNLPMDLLTVIKDYGVEIEIDNNIKMAELYHSLYVNNHLSKKIIIYSEWIQPLQITELNLRLPEETIYYMHLAHEYYHLLEDCTIFNTQYYKKNRKTCSEIGAHIFVTEYLKLPIHPRLIGYLIAIEKEWISSNEFIIMMERNISKLSEKGVAINDFFIR